MAVTVSYIRSAAFKLILHSSWCIHSLAPSDRPVRVSGFRFRVSGFGSVSGFEFLVTGCGLRVAGCGLRVAGCGLRVSGFGLRNSRFGFRASGFWQRAEGFGFRIEGLGTLLGWLLAPSEEGRCKATWKREFKLPWHEAGPPNHHDDEVDSDQ